VRKPARLPDGSLPEPKKTVAKKLDALEAALLARAAADKKVGQKRKAAGKQGGAGPKKK
jgi:hypothetical protein